MAINPQKLLPPSKMSTSERMSASYDKRIDDLLNLNVKRKFIDVDKLLKNSFLKKKKEENKKKKKKQTEKRQEKEKNLELPKGIEGISKVKSLIPKTGILDAVQNFATFTFLGYLLTKFGGEMPKLVGILQKAVPILNISEKIIGGIFEGIVGFIDAGYKVHDQMRVLSKDIGGEKAQKVYDDFSTNFNRFLNAIATLGLSELGRGDEKPPEKKSGGGMVRGYARGGQATRGGKSVDSKIGRTLKVQRFKKPQKVQPEKTSPGKDVGGKLRIEKLYPNPKPVSTTTRSPNPYKALTGVSEDLKKGGWIGYLMAAGVDVALGQKVNSKKLATAITGGLGTLSQIDQSQGQAIGTLGRSLLGMAAGGEVPPLGQQTENVNNLLATLIQSRVNEALKNVTDELLKTPGATPGGGPGGPGGGPGGAGGAPTTKEQRDAFERIRSIAEKLGSPNPDVTASIAMWETGWLANPDSVYFASNKTNPFGQTGKGPKGSVIGKDGQEHAVYNSIEEGVKAHLDNWKSDYRGKTAEEIIESIRQGGGRGMYNTNPAWSNNVLGVYNSIKQPPTKIIKGGPIKGGGIITQRGDPDAEKTGIDISLGGIGANIQNPFDNLKITGTGFQGSGSGETGTGYGNYVTGEVTINGKKYELLLGHLDRISVKKGDVLSAGDVIGKQGISGRATGPHVSTHINALSGGDPQKILDAVENVWTSGGSIQTDLGQKPKPKPKPTSAAANKGVIFDRSKKEFIKLGGGLLGSNQKISVTNTENTNLRATVKAFGLGQGTEGQIKQAKDGNLYKFINGKWTTYTLYSGRNMQGGGFMGLQNKRNYSSLSMYPSYDGGGGMMLAVQPIIIEKPVPVPMSQNKTIIFPIPVSVNNNTASLSR